MIAKIAILIALVSVEVSGRYKTSIVFETSYDECGIMSSSAGLIQGGNNSTQIQFPWMAILSVRKNEEWDQNGSGSLISKKHVLAKSRYVATIDENNFYVPISAEDVKIFLGTTKYDDLTQPGSLKTGITRINLYPNSRKIVQGFSIFNFAILTLENGVAFNDVIKPVCLWRHEHNHEMFTGQRMMAVGYGRDLSGKISKIRKHVTVQVTSSEDCEEENEFGLQFVDESRFFCIKEIEMGNGPCHFDTQLYLKVGPAWYLKGEMISARVDPETLYCDASYPVGVEDISDYIEWIDEQIKPELVEIHTIVKENNVAKVIENEVLVDSN